MIFTPKEQRFLQDLGRGENGRDLINLLTRANQEYSSINGIDGGKDYGAQVEGRKLFVEFANELIEQMKTKTHVPRPTNIEDYE